MVATADAGACAALLAVTSIGASSVTFVLSLPPGVPCARSAAGASSSASTAAPRGRLHGCPFTRTSLAVVRRRGNPARRRTISPNCVVARPGGSGEASGGRCLGEGKNVGEPGAPDQRRGGRLDGVERGHGRGEQRPGRRSGEDDLVGMAHALAPVELVRGMVVVTLAGPLGRGALRD